MDLDADGNPLKQKISRLTVASDKAHGLLGKVDLDLSRYGEEDFLVQQLPLEGCEYEGAFIEVGLKGAESKAPLSKGSPTAEGAAATNSSMLLLV